MIEAIAPLAIGLGIVCILFLLGGLILTWYEDNYENDDDEE